MKKYIVSFGFVLVILIIASLLFFDLNNKEINHDTITFTSSYDEIKDKISDDASTCSFEDYFEIVRAEYLIIPNENLMKQSVVMKNITGKDISFNYQVYKEQKLIDKYVSSLAPALPPNGIPIELPDGKRAVTSMASGFLYSFSNFTEAEKKDIDELASKLYIEFSIDGKIAYFEVDLQKVNQFSEY